MRTAVNITGQIAGNHRLARAIKTIDSTETKLPFNGIRLEFPTKREAKAALKSAHKILLMDEPEFKNGYYLSNNKETLYYDASKAEIYNPIV